MIGWILEAVLPDGSQVWIGPAFGLVIAAGEIPSVEATKLLARFHRATTRVPGPYSGT